MLASLFRFVAVAILYVAAGILGMLALGAAISTPGDAAQAETLRRDGLLLLAGAAIAAWSAGILWVGPVVDFASKRRASAVSFFVLALVFGLPSLLLLMGNESRLVSDARFITWALSPPALIIGLWRLIRRSPPKAR